MSLNMENLESFVKLLSVFSVDKKESDKSDKESNSLIGHRVIIRSRDAGVMYGTLVSVNRRHVKLEDARKVWRFFNTDGALCTNDLAKEGVEINSGSKLSAFVERLEMLEACTILMVSKKAEKKLDEYPVFKKEED